MSSAMLTTSQSTGAEASVAAAESMQGMVVWTLLLQQWDPLDQAVLCKLLCCSQAMAKLVHGTCAGRLSVHMPPGTFASDQPASNKLTLDAAVDSASGTHLPNSSAYSTWLAANSTLLHSLTLPDFNAPEDAIAQGLDAAVAAAAMAAAADASNHRGDCSGIGSSLPLQRLTCNIPTSGAVVCSLASSAQLTSLWLRLAFGDFAPTFLESLAGLTSLRELTLGMHFSDSAVWTVDHHNQCQFMSRALLPTLQRLTGLTRLNLTPDLDPESCGRQRMLSFYMPADCGHLFPACLVCLDTCITVGAEAAGGTPVNLGHLTAVSALRLVDLGGQDVLPPNVEVLTLHTCRSLGPLLPTKLPRLLQLTIDNCSFDKTTLQAAELQSLQQLTQLTDLKLKLWGGGYGDADYYKALSCLASLPVSELECWQYSIIPAEFLRGLGGFSKLTRLSLTRFWTSVGVLDCCWGGAAVGALASQLSRLSALQELQLHAKPADPTVAVLRAVRPATGWQTLLQAMVKLPSLRHVELSHCGLGAAAVELCGATQLTRLVLRDCVGRQDWPTKVALCFGLKQLMPECLTVCP